MHKNETVISKQWIKDRQKIIQDDLKCKKKSIHNLPFKPQSSAFTINS